MDGIIAKLSRTDKRRLQTRCRKLKDGDLKTVCLIILNLADGRSAADTAKALNVHRSSVYRAAARFRHEGEDGLIDHREENGDIKRDDELLSALWELVTSSPLDHGGKRPTWTREMLVQTRERKTGVRIHVSTMSVALAKIGARRATVLEKAVPADEPARTDSHYLDDHVFQVTIAPETERSDPANSSICKRGTFALDAAACVYSRTSGEALRHDRERRIARTSCCLFILLRPEISSCAAVSYNSSFVCSWREPFPEGLPS